MTVHADVQEIATTNHERHLPSSVTRAANAVLDLCAPEFYFLVEVIRRAELFTLLTGWCV